MNQIGDIKVFSLDPAPTVHQFGTLTYVYKWWDGTVSVSNDNVVSKKLNRGGDVSYSVEVVNEVGQSGSYGSSLNVNAPPEIVRSPSISENNASFPYQTQIVVKSYDPELTLVDFLWTKDGVDIGGGSTITSLGTGTNTFDRSVSEEETLQVKMIDAGNGTSLLDFDMYGFQPLPPEVIQSALPVTLVSDASNLPLAVIGEGQFVNFTVFASDTVDGILAFNWAFYGTNGWSATTLNSGTTLSAINGVLQNNSEKDISLETPGIKVAEATVHNLHTNQVTVTRSSVTLEQSIPPTVNTIDTDATLVDLERQVNLADSVSYTAVASDANNDILDYRWDFTQPAGVIMYGKTIVLEPSDYVVFSESVVDRPIVGVLTVTDRFDESDTANIPVVTVLI